MIYTDATVVDVQGKTLFDRVSDFLTAKDWGFTVGEDRTFFSFGLRLRDATVRVVVVTVESDDWCRFLV